MLFGFHAAHPNLMYNSCVITFLPPTVMATVRPPKRRRRGQRLPPIIEGSDMSLDTAMYVQSDGGDRILVSVRPDEASQTNVEAEADPGPEPDDPLEYQ